MTGLLLPMEAEFAEAGVADMANAREARAAKQLELLKSGEGCVVCLTLNVAGPMKRSGLTDGLFFEAAARLANALANEGFSQRLCSLTEGPTGLEAIFHVRAEAGKVKRVTVKLEDETAASRLLDIDVIGSTGRKEARSTPRKCLICGENAAVCARSRAHSVRELQQRTAELLRPQAAERAAELAYDALVREVKVTPKAGLVDQDNCGANPDMDVPMFIKSAETLKPFFRRIACAVLDGAAGECPLTARAELTDPALASKLRSIGVEAERAMLDATGGVNTHRGAIWSVGILTAAYAYCETASFNNNGEGSVRENMTAALLFAAKTLAHTLGDGTADSSNGAAVRRKYGVGGPVEQAKEGFPLAVKAICAKRAYLENKIEDGFIVDPWAYALLAVMAELDDNNALRRGAAEGARFVKTRSKELLALGLTVPFSDFIYLLREFDYELIRKNISCGGAADMLSCAIFIEDAALRFRAAEESFIRGLYRECRE